MLRLAARLSLFGALACASAPVEIDAPRDLQGFRTWEWRQPADAPVTVPADPVLDARLRDAIARELYSRGFRPSTGEHADLGVTYRVALTRELVVRTEARALQYLPSLHSGPSFEIGASERRVVPYERFALHVELRESATGDVVWRAHLEDRTRGRLVARADDAVAALLRELPPRRERI
jgi:Domain of unknown function (DUF4136)